MSEQTIAENSVADQPTQPTKRRGRKSMTTGLWLKVASLTPHQTLIVETTPEQLRRVRSQIVGRIVQERKINPQGPMANMFTRKLGDQRFIIVNGMPSEATEVVVVVP